MFTGGYARQVTGGMEGEVRVWNTGFQTQTMDASLKVLRGSSHLEVWGWV